MFDVDSTSDEYALAVKEFNQSLERTSIKVDIEKLERIESVNKYKVHIALEDSIRGKHMYKKQVPVRRLFHGTKQDSIKEISVQGFNRIFAAEANGEL